MINSEASWWESLQCSESTAVEWTKAIRGQPWLFAFGALVRSYLQAEGGPGKTCTMHTTQKPVERDRTRTCLIIFSVNTFDCHGCRPFVWVPGAQELASSLNFRSNYEQLQWHQFCRYMSTTIGCQDGMRRVIAQVLGIPFQKMRMDLFGTCWYQVSPWAYTSPCMIRGGHRQPVMQVWDVQKGVPGFGRFTLILLPLVLPPWGALQVLEKKRIQKDVASWNLYTVTGKTQDRPGGSVIELHPVHNWGCPWVLK